MNIHLIIFVSSTKDTSANVNQAAMMRTYESTIRPIVGDLIDDPGFDSRFHNGYEVVKVTLNYASNECWVSLAPIAIELENIGVNEYIEKLQSHGWRKVSREELNPNRN